MKLSDIKSALIGTIALKDFKASISDEIIEYVSLSRKKGASMPVYLDEDVDLTIGENEFRVLCEAFLDGELNEVEIGYIADALLLSGRVFFDNESLSDRIGYLTDPEVNGVINKDTVRNILKP